MYIPSMFFLMAVFCISSRTVISVITVAILIIICSSFPVLLPVLLLKSCLQIPFVTSLNKGLGCSC